MSLITTILKVHARFVYYCAFAQSLTLLSVRYWLFKSFFFSGWLKTKNWQSTLFLFEHEYQVPIIPYEIAAYLGTAAEIGLPILIFLGLFTRLSTVGLFIFNLIILVSYPFLWTVDGQMGLEHHLVWGLLMLVLISFGPGKVSVDWMLNRKCKDYVY